MTRKWVRQEDPGGCGAATLAIILGCTYQAAKELIEEQLWDSGDGEGPTRKPPNWQEGGITQYHLDRALYEHGYFKQTRYASWGYDITQPFAPVHWAIVQQPSNNYHFVVMQHDGSVLDPLHEQPRRLSDFPQVHQVCGLVRDATAVAAAATRYVRVAPEGIPALTEDAHFQLLRAVTTYTVDGELDVEIQRPCTCTIACIPQGLAPGQVCRLQL